MDGCLQRDSRAPKRAGSRMRGGAAGGGRGQLQKRSAQADRKPSAGGRPGVPEGRWGAKELLSLSGRGAGAGGPARPQGTRPSARGTQPGRSRAAAPEGTSEAAGRVWARTLPEKVRGASAALTAAQAAIRAPRPRGLRARRRPGRPGTGPLLLLARAARSKRLCAPLPCRSRAPPAASSASVGR